MKKLIVQKYGGTSVGSIDRIKHVAKQIVDTKNKGYNVVVVVSAMGNTTNELINKAMSINSNPSKRELDVLLATGEQISISLLAMAIQSLNESVVSLTGTQCGIITDKNHQKSKIKKINTKRIEYELSEGKIVISAGFQGINKNKDITTLGRGGSDTTAVALAAALNACECEIYTDVDGVYTADPRIIRNAKIINKISYDEMIELANLGAKVLHPRSVQLASKFKVPLVVKSSFNKGTGTKIVEVDNMESSIVKGISLDNNIAKISILNIPRNHDISFKLFSSLACNNIHFDMITQNIKSDSLNEISFITPLDDIKNAMKITKEIAGEIGVKNILCNKSVSKISIVGKGISGNAYAASTFFQSMHELNLDSYMISTSEIRISCVINKDMSIKALKYIHDKFHLSKNKNNNIAI